MLIFLRIKKDLKIVFSPESSRKTNQNQTTVVVGTGKLHKDTPQDTHAILHFTTHTHLRIKFLHKVVVFLVTSFFLKLFCTFAFTHLLYNYLELPCHIGTMNFKMVFANELVCEDEDYGQTGDFLLTRVLCEYNSLHTINHVNHTYMHVYVCHNYENLVFAIKQVPYTHSIFMHG